MADKFTPPLIDWTSSGDVHKRFKLSRKKCEFIFEGLLEGIEQKKQVRQHSMKILQNCMQLEVRRSLHSSRSHFKGQKNVKAKDDNK